MNPPYTSILFFILFAMSLGWLAMVRSLFESLEENHSQKYEEMGEPSLFAKNTARTNWALLKFLFTRAPEALNDSSLMVSVNVMRVWLPLYLAGFVWLVVVATSSHNG